MSEINPYAPPQAEPVAAKPNVFVLQFVSSKEFLIDAAAEEKRRMITRLVAPAMIGSVAVSGILIGLASIFEQLTLFFAGIFMPVFVVFAYAVIDHLCWRSFRATAEAEVDSLLARHPSLQYGAWEVQFDAHHLALTCGDQLFLWHHSELERIPIVSGISALKGACFIKTPLFLLPIPFGAANRQPFAEFVKVVQERLKG